MKLIIGNENFTPEYFVKPCRDFLGGFDLDAFSCEEANQVIQAKTYFHLGNNALFQDWTPFKTKWVQPPYSRDLIGKAVAKTLHYKDIGETLLLTNSSTSSKWFHLAMTQCDIYMHPKQRIQFFNPYKKHKNKNLYDQTLFYFGYRWEEFAYRLASLGDFARPYRSN